MHRHFVLASVLILTLLGGATAHAGPITVTGLPTKGALPIITTAFTTAAGTDVLPAGATDYYVFTLFDTGTTRVVLRRVAAATLGVSNGMVTDVRLNGLGAVDPVTLEAPIYAGASAGRGGGGAGRRSRPLPRTSR